MKCRTAQELIHVSLDEPLRSAERRALDDHLAGCATCRRELETTRALLGVLADVPRRQLSAGFDSAFSARLAEIGPRRSPWPAWGRIWQMNAWRMRPALVPVAGVLVALATFQLVPPKPPAPVPANASSAYLAQCLREHEAVAHWRELPEAAVDFNLQVSSAATVADDLIQ
jgi:hypothetical protein